MEETANKQELLLWFHDTDLWSYFRYFYQKGSSTLSFWRQVTHWSYQKEFHVFLPLILFGGVNSRKLIFLFSSSSSFSFCSSSFFSFLSSSSSPSSFLLPLLLLFLLLLRDSYFYLLCRREQPRFSILVKAEYPGVGSRHKNGFDRR